MKIRYTITEEDFDKAEAWAKEHGTKLRECKCPNAQALLRVTGKEWKVEGPEEVFPAELDKETATRCTLDSNGTLVIEMYDAIDASKFNGMNYEVVRPEEDVKFAKEEIVGLECSLYCPDDLLSYADDEA